MSFKWKLILSNFCLVLPWDFGVTSPSSAFLKFLFTECIMQESTMILEIVSWTKISVNSDTSHQVVRCACGCWRSMANGCGLHRIGRANDSTYAEINFYGRLLTNDIKVPMKISSYAVCTQKSSLYPHSSKHASLHTDCYTFEPGIQSNIACFVQ